MERKYPWLPVWSQAKKAWTVDFRVSGRRIRKFLPVHDKNSRDIAKEMAFELYRSALTEPLDQRPKKLTFYDAATHYLATGGEARFVGKLVRHLGKKIAIDEIDEIAIARIGIELYPDAKPDTLRRQVRVPLKAVINFANGRRRQRSTDNPRVRWLSPEEVERLLLVASNPTAIGLRDPRLETLRKIAFMIGTGAGPSETMTIKVEDWNPSTSEWWLPGTKTAFRQRFVRLPPRTFSLIQPLPSRGPAFPAPNGQPYVMRENGGGQMAAAFSKVCEAAGLGKDVTPYVLRHTWATFFYAQTKDWAALLDQGGWNRSDTANRYRKIAPADLGTKLLSYGWDYRISEGPPVKFGELIQLRNTV